MPELPDIVAYLEALEPRVVGRRIEAVRIASPFLVRSVEPPLRQVEGRRVVGLRRIGKRVVFQLEGDLFLVLHLMVAGRLHWKARGAKLAGRVGLAAFDFENGTLLLTEASTKKRASLHLARGEKALVEFDRGGIEPLEADLPLFREALTRENHTVKRALTDPRLFSGIGNAYSDEILHRARLSPAKLTKRMTGRRDRAAPPRDARDARGVDRAASSRRRARRSRRRSPPSAREWPCTAATESPARSAARRCSGSSTPRTSPTTAPTCQTGGKLLADRALSQLLKGDWPKTLEELEERKGRSAAPLTPPLSPLRGGEGVFTLSRRERVGVRGVFSLSRRERAGARGVFSKSSERASFASRRPMWRRSSGVAFVAGNCSE